MFWRVVGSEWKKVRRSGIWIPSLVAPLVPVLAGIFAVPHGSGHLKMAMNAWQAVYFNMIFVYGILLLPLLAGVIASLLCRYEHLAGGWKQVLAMPVSRTSVYAAKFLFVLGLLALAQLLMLGGFLFVGYFVLHTQTPIPWMMVCKGLIGGWAATIPLAALQLWVSTWWKSFGAQFAINVIMTIPATIVANSHVYGPLYPWAQPALAMVPRHYGALFMTPEMACTIGISGLIFAIIGWLHFVRRDVYV